MHIRAAEPADIPRLLGLVRRYWDFEAIGSFNALRIELLLKHLMGNPARGAIWVAESAGTLAGYLIVVLVMSVEHQRFSCPSVTRSVAAPRTLARPRSYSQPTP